MLSYRRHTHWTRFLIPLAILVLALLVRTPGLDRFATPDEHLWIDRSRQFVGGLLFADYECPPRQGEWGRQVATQGWGCTFQTSHPGITTMWAGSLGLLFYYWQTVSPSGIDIQAFLRTLDVSSLDPALLASARLPMALAGAFFVLLYYILVRRLFDDRIAVVSSLLLALSPFHIALTRLLHHDALNAMLMVLSLLLMIGYWFQGWKRWFLLFSGVLAGIAFLTKAVGWFMMPYVVIAGVLSLYYRPGSGRWPDRSELWKLVTDWVLWGAAAGLAFVGLFPAMWTIPVQVVRGIVSAYQLVQEGHTHYFLGQVSADPGPLFYPIGWLLRASPLELLGVLGFLIAIVQSYRRQCRASLYREPLNRPLLLSVVIFLVAFLLFMTVASKKMVRYFLPAFPIIDIFAAIGLLWIVSSLSQHMSVKAAQRWGWILICGLILLLQGWFVLDNYPYYFTFYNPLLGGATGAARLMTVGWGEAMDEVGAFLNQQPRAESLRVAAWYNETLNPFFVGSSQPLGRQLGEAMQADYVVYYRSQLQRRLQNIQEWQYFDRHLTSVHRVTLHGLDYALIYRNPIQHHLPLLHSDQSDGLNLFGYNLTADGNLILFWQNQGLGEGQQLWAGLVSARVDDASQETYDVTCLLDHEFAAEATMPGTIVESSCPLGSAGAPAGFYHLRLALSHDASIPSTGWSTPQIAISVDPAGRFIASLAPLTKDKLPQDVTTLDIAYGDMSRLVGYRFEASEWRPGEGNALYLYWQPTQRLDLSLINVFQIVLSLYSHANSDPVLATVYPVLPHSPALDDLRTGAVLPARYSLVIPETLSAGEYTLDVCLTTVTSETVRCLPLSITVSSPRR